MEENSIKREEFSDEEMGAINEEKLFLAEPIKIEYQLMDCEYKSNTNFGSSGRKSKLSAASHDPVFPVKQEKMDDSSELSALPPIGEESTSGNPEPQHSFEATRSGQVLFKEEKVLFKEEKVLFKEEKVLFKEENFTEEVSFKEEEFSDEEAAAINEEKLFLAEPIKIEYQLKDYEYKIDTDFGRLSPKAEIDVASLDPAFLIKQEKAVEGEGEVRNKELEKKKGTDPEHQTRAEGQKREEEKEHTYDEEQEEDVINKSLCELSGSRRPTVTKRCAKRAVQRKLQQKESFLPPGRRHDHVVKSHPEPEAKSNTEVEPKKNGAESVEHANPSRKRKQEAESNTEVEPKKNGAESVEHANRSRKQEAESNTEVEPKKNGAESVEYANRSRKQEAESNTEVERKKNGAESVEHANRSRKQEAESNTEVERKKNGAESAEHANPSRKRKQEAESNTEVEPKKNGTVSVENANPSRKRKQDAESNTEVEPKKNEAESVDHANPSRKRKQEADITAEEERPPSEAPLEPPVKAQKTCSNKRTTTNLHNAASVPEADVRNVEPPPLLIINPLIKSKKNPSFPPDFRSKLPRSEVASTDTEKVPVDRIGSSAKDTKPADAKKPLRNPRQCNESDFPSSKRGSDEKILALVSSIVSERSSKVTAPSEVGGQIPSIPDLVWFPSAVTKGRCSDRRPRYDSSAEPALKDKIESHINPPPDLEPAEAKSRSSPSPAPPSSEHQVNTQFSKVDRTNSAAEEEQDVEADSQESVQTNAASLVQFEKDVRHQNNTGSRVYLKPGGVPHIFRPPDQKSSEEESSGSKESTDSTLSTAADFPASGSETLNADDSNHERISGPLNPQDVEDDNRSNGVLVCSVKKGESTLPGKVIETSSNFSTLLTTEGAEALCFRSESASIATSPPKLVPFICDKETQTRPVKVEHKFVTAKPYFRSKFIHCSIISKKETRDAQTSPCENAEKSSGKRVNFSSTPQSMGFSQYSEEYNPHPSSGDEGEDLGYDGSLKTRSINTKLCLDDSVYFLGVPISSLSLIYTLGKHTNSDPLHIIICLRKIRLNETFLGLSYDFGLSESYVTKIFKNVVPKLAQCLSTLVMWPSRQKIKERLPIPFRARYSVVQSIIDCFEIEIEKPSDPVNQTLTWSNYEYCTTLKYLISCTPDGLINFVSKGFGGKTSDVKLTELCGFLDVIPEGAGIMADRRFKDLEKHLETAKCVLLRPPSVSAVGTMTSKDEVMETKSLGIHIERIVGRVREFDMLKPHACVHNSLIKYVDNIVQIVCGLINLHDPLNETFV